MELINSPPVYHTSSAQKARSKQAAHRFKYGSPKLVDAMREKCRLRIKEARNEHLFQKRNIIQEERDLLEIIVRQELSELEQDIQLQELIFRELIAETDEWLFAEYEKCENYLIDEYGQEQIICPVCQRAALKVTDSQQAVVRCDCGIQLRLPDGQMEPFGKVLRDTVEEHGSRCESNLQFFVEPLPGSDCGQLNAFCPGCDYYKSLTKG